MNLQKTFATMENKSEDIIKDKPWARDMLTWLQDGLLKSFLCWVTIVCNLSDNDQNVDEWIKTFKATFEETCCEILLDMEDLETKVCIDIEKKLEKVKNLCQLLECDIPHLGPGTRGLFEEQKHLKNIISDYEQKIKLCKDNMEKLRNRERELCLHLGRQPRAIIENNNNALPTKNEIDTMKEYINKLEEEYFNRNEIFCNIKQELIEIVKELKYKPTDKFEMEVLMENDNFKVTDDNMQLLRNFHRNLLREHQSVKEQITVLWNEIEKVWNILDHDLLERETFRKKHQGFSLSTLTHLKAEYARCETIKKNNIQNFIEKLRSELKELWQKCHVDDEEGQNRFDYWNSDYYTEDLLGLYEFEVEKWRKYYEENQELLLLREKHSSYWSKMLQFENKTADPNRFNNRGGQLLKEEKERNMITKKIPSIESKLIELADKFAARYGIVFTSFGQTIPEYLENLHADRENTKKQKSSARKNLLSPRTPMKSTMSLFTSTSNAPHSTTSKRKLMAAPATTPAGSQKKLKLTPKTALTSPPKKVNKVKKIAVAISSLSKRHSTERSLRKKLRRSVNKSRKKSATDTSSSDFVEFMDELASRADSRSTLLPVVENVNQQFLQLPPPFAPAASTRTPNKSTTKRGAPSPKSATSSSTKLTISKSNSKLRF